MTASTNFVNGTVVSAAWLNAVDAHVFDETIDVTRYGAVGNGTTDDTAAINLAIAALVAGAELYFPPCADAYMVNSTLTPLPAYTGVRCAPGTFLRRKLGSGNMHFFQASNGCVFTNVNLDGNSYPTSGGMGGTWLSSSYGLGNDWVSQTDDVVVRGGQMINLQYGIHTEGARTWRISDVYFNNIQNCGILMVAPAGLTCNYNIISDCEFYLLGDCAVGFLPMSGGPGPYSDLSYNKVCDCIAVDTTQLTNGYSFDVESGAAVDQVHHNSFVNNTVNFQLTPAVTQGGFTMGPFSEYGIISGNTIHGNKHGRGDAGVACANAKYMLISENVIEGFRWTGIYTDGATDVLVEGNTIRDCGDTSDIFPGIHIAQTEDTSNITVKNNYLSWNDAYAYTGSGTPAIGCIVATGKVVKNIVIADNTINNPTDIGIKCIGQVGWPIENLVIENNRIFGGQPTLFTREPIDVRFANYARICGNFVKDSKRGIRATDCTHVAIRGNSLQNAIADTLPSWVDITTTTNCSIIDNEFGTAVTTKINPATQVTDATKLNTVYNNIGLVTEATGVTGAIASLATVTHGMTYTPTIITLQPMDGTPTAFFPSTIGATTFAITYTGGGTHAFSWTAKYR